MSKIADKIAGLLDSMFPKHLGERVVREVYIPYKNSKLFFDFYVKELGVYVEVQGRQHTEFVKHFHGTREAFVAQKYRDNLKIQYVQEHDKCLIRFNYDEKVTKTLIKKKINKVLTGECFYE
jgi:hypothetical protein